MSVSLVWGLELCPHNINLFYAQNDFSLVIATMCINLNLWVSRNSNTI